MPELLPPPPHPARNRKNNINPIILNIAEIFIAILLRFY
jgi:hypothetical protein